jgi:hypothetical protein
VCVCGGCHFRLSPASQPDIHIIISYIIIIIIIIYYPTA